MIKIVDSEMGNIRSVLNAFLQFGAAVEIAKTPKDLDSASHIVLPGVGAFGHGMNALRSNGFADEIYKQIVTHNKFFLGICLGMQVLADIGNEFGSHQGLGIIRGSVKKLEDPTGTLTLPHVGWNEVTFQKKHFLFDKIKDSSDFYFVHSYHFLPSNPSDIGAITEYGCEFASVILKDNILATQFHPEKSQECGLQLLLNFSNWT